jgi:hypothetical protein
MVCLKTYVSVYMIMAIYTNPAKDRTAWIPD